MDLNFTQFITFFLLTASMISLWLPGKQTWGWVWLAFFVIAVISGFLNGYINQYAFITFILVPLSCYYAEKQAIPVYLKVISCVSVLCLSLAILGHIMPGFNNPKIISDLILSPEAIPFSKYLNFDKTILGIFLLYFGHHLITGLSEFKTLLIKTAPGALITMGAFYF